MRITDTNHESLTLFTDFRKDVTTIIEIEYLKGTKSENEIKYKHV